ncbi:hypothetical protein HK405_012723 [Cladochytrium tenue]|nr:hypothetical protein HK405_012723 [Cladochytrium tenue]
MLIGALLSAGLRLVFFFDGAVTKSRRVLWEQRRAQELGELAKSWAACVSGRKGGGLPRQAVMQGRQAFVRAVVERHQARLEAASAGAAAMQRRLEVHVARGEADREAALHALALSAGHDGERLLGVLSGDSDFALYCSAIGTTWFWVPETYPASTSSGAGGGKLAAVVVRCVTSGGLSRAFGAAHGRGELLGLLGPLCGNDVVEPDAARQIRGSLKLPQVRGGPSGGGGGGGGGVTAIVRSAVLFVRGDIQTNTGLCAPRDGTRRVLVAIRGAGLGKLAAAAVAAYDLQGTGPQCAGEAEVAAAEARLPERVVAAAREAFVTRAAHSLLLFSTVMFAPTAEAEELPPVWETLEPVLRRIYPSVAGGISASGVVEEVVYLRDPPFRTRQRLAKAAAVTPAPTMLKLVDTSLPLLDRLGALCNMCDPAHGPALCAELASHPGWASDPLPTLALTFRICEQALLPPTGNDEAGVGIRASHVFCLLLTVLLHVVPGARERLLERNAEQLAQRPEMGRPPRVPGQLLVARMPAPADVDARLVHASSVWLRSLDVVLLANDVCWAPLHGTAALGHFDGFLLHALHAVAVAERADWDHHVDDVMDDGHGRMAAVESGFIWLVARLLEGDEELCSRLLAAFVVVVGKERTTQLSASQPPACNMN